MRSRYCIRVALALVLMLQLTWLPACLAQQPAAPTSPGNLRASTSSGQTRVNLDLNSTASSLSGQSALELGGASNGSVQILQNGSVRQVNASSVLSPAQYMAVTQVLTGGKQTLTIGSAGNAVGGSFILPQALSTNLSNLVVPRGVTATSNFASAQALHITGDLTNFGNFYAVSTSTAIAAVTISATNITNHTGAFITSVLPIAGLSGLSGLVPVMNLKLMAANNLVNMGTISSSGGLSLSAGNLISNGIASGLSPNSSAELQAAGGLSLTANHIINNGSIASQLGSIRLNTPTLINSGTIRAAQGDVAIQNLIGNQLSVINSAGSISALMTLLFQTSDIVGTAGIKGAISVSGGTLAGADVRFVSPHGAIAVDADRIDGGVDVAGGTAAVGVNGGTLNIVGMKLTGDPIYYNSSGNLDLSGLFSSGSTFSSAGGDFVALASGSITAGTAPVGALIDAANLGGVGGIIHIASGVNFTVSGGASPAACTTCTGLYSITGPSGTGGSINMPNVSLRTNANNVTLQSNGSINIGNLQSSGVGGLAGGGGMGQAGQSAGTISVIAVNAITTGGLQAYGGGGGGSTNGAGGGAGGAGGAIQVSNSLAGAAITINGAINSSGGGGGGGQGIGGTGGNAGLVSVVAMGALNVAGPVLAAGGGGGGGGTLGADGGGSFGGGGGGGSAQGAGGYGGGGLYGGGSSIGYSNGAGGGAQGGGSAGNFGTAGSYGLGGGGASFGTGLFNSGNVGSRGYGASGGVGGANADVLVKGSTVALTETAGSLYLAPVSSSPYANISAAGKNVSVVSTTATAPTVAGTLAIGDSGTLNVLRNTATAVTTLGSVGYIGSSAGTASLTGPAGQPLSIGTIYLYQGAGSFNVTSQNALTIGSIIGNTNSTLYRGGALNLLAPGAITVSGNVNASSSNITASSTGSTITSGMINTSGSSGPATTAGQAGGDITLTALSGISVGGIQAYGAGGGGVTNGANGGTGGDGGNIQLNTTGSLANISVSGDINSSGGGGGGGQGLGGAGGKAGTISVVATGSLSIDGPVLAFGGGGGAGGALGDGGGGSFGGGGGGGSAQSATGIGGGGIYGGGLTYVYNTSFGGGYQGGGASTYGANGSYGLGGGGTAFGIGGNGAGNVATAGTGASGGSAGVGASVSLQGTSVSISETVGSSYGAPMNSSNYSSISVGGRDVSIISTGISAFTAPGAVVIGNGGTLNAQYNTQVSPTTVSNFTGLGYIGTAGGSATISDTSGQNLSIGTLYLYQAFSNLTVNSAASLNIGAVTQYYDQANFQVGSLTLGAATNVTVSGDIATPGSALAVSAGSGSITLNNITTGGFGGAGGDAGQNGQSGGSITLAAGTGITTGFLRAYGGGGGSSCCYSQPGGAGGAGGIIQLSSTAGPININGDVNSSGGGGGASAGTVGGAGAAAGAISVATSGGITVAGPLLAAGGGGGAINTVGAAGGGGSFGGGGGGQGSFWYFHYGEGGGGIYGGGSATYVYSGDDASGGGFQGGGIGGHGGPAGTYGQGGGGPLFGLGGYHAGNVGAAAFGALGGAAGLGGDVNLQGDTVSITKNVGTAYGAPMSSSPFAAIAVAGKSITIKTISSPFANAGTLVIGDGGTLGVQTNGVPANSFNAVGYIGSVGGTASISGPAGEDLSITSIHLFQGAGNLNITSQANLNIGSVSGFVNSSFFKGGALSLSAPANATLGTVNAPGSAVSATIGGTLTTVGIDTSGIGGNGGSGGEIGQVGGAITLTATNAVTTGYLRAYGGGGGSSCCTGGNGGIGAAGGAIFVNSATTTVTVNGDINTSGGGGGGAGQSANGGAGGSAGAVTILSPVAITISGPVLAAGGGGGAGNEYGAAGGGGSFGGGGGGGGSSAYGGGGGGYYGGGSAFYVYPGDEAQGGGFQGGGTGAFGGPNGAAGTGGGGAAFGMGGLYAGNVSTAGYGSRGGAAGTGATVTLQGSTIAIAGTVASQYGAPYSTSPFANIALAGGTFAITATAAAGTSISIAGQVGLMPTTTSAASTITAQNPSNISIQQISFYEKGQLTVTSAGTISLGSVASTPAVTPGATSGNISILTGSSLTLSGAAGVSVIGSLRLPSGAPNGLGVQSLASITILSSAGNISVGDVDTSGVGGSASGSLLDTYLGAGGHGGVINLTATGNISTGSLRSFGGGAFGTYSDLGAEGGAGGAISITGGGTVLVGNDINVSGGGGGGTGGATGVGGYGGKAGTLSISATGAVAINGPVLAAGGGGGSVGGYPLSGSPNGGGSFGGGGASWGAAAGGGLYGGSSIAYQNQGGGFFGPGINTNGGTYQGYSPGEIGQGGNIYGASAGIFGMSGGNNSSVGNAGVSGVASGTVGYPGNNGTVTISGASVNVSGTVANSYAPLSSLAPNPFTTSPFANVGVYSGDLTITATSGTVQVSGDIRTNASASNVKAGNINISGQGGVNLLGSVNTSSTIGNGGDVKIGSVAGNITVVGQINTQSSGTSLFTKFGYLNAYAGNVTIDAASVGAHTVTLNSINAAGLSGAFGGDVLINMPGTSSLNVLNSINTSAADNTAGGITVTGNSTGSMQLNSLGTVGSVALNASSSGSSHFAGSVKIVLKDGLVPATPVGSVVVTGGISTVGLNGAQSSSVVMGANTVTVTGLINTSNNLMSGGAVDLAAASNLTVADINASFTGAVTAKGSGGLIMAAAGTAGSGTLSIGNIQSRASGNGSAAGSVITTSTGSISLGTVDISGTNAAIGGKVSILATSSSGAAVVTYGNINTSGAIGGNVAIVALGDATNGASIAAPSSSITTDATSADSLAGSITMLAFNQISTGAISARALTSGPSNSAYGGDVLISTGSTAANAITTGTINTSAYNYAGNVFLVTLAGAGITVGGVSATPGAIPATITLDKTGGAVPGAQGFLFDTPIAAGPATISGTLTVQFSTAGTSGNAPASNVTGFNPGGYSSVAAGTVDLIIDSSGDPRLFIPVAVTAGNVTLNSITSAVTAGAATPISIYANGSISVNSSVSLSSASAPAPSVSFQTNQGSVTLNSVSLSGTTGGTLIINSPTNFTLNDGQSLSAQSIGNVGPGGQIIIAVPFGGVNLGSSGNTSSNTINTSGASGGLIQIASHDDINIYGVSLISTGTTGIGGTVDLSSYEGSTNLFNNHQAINYNANIDVSSSGSTGGTVTIFGKAGVQIAADPAGCTNCGASSIINANGATGGGIITIQTGVVLTGGVVAPSNINLSDALMISADGTNASNSIGGVIDIFTPTGTVTSSNLSASGTSGGRIISNSSNFLLPDGNTAKAIGNNGNGGAIELYTAGIKVYTPGWVQLGSAGNQTDSYITASGTADGGQITVLAGSYFISNEVGVYASGGVQTGANSYAANAPGAIASATGGNGGQIDIYTASGDITLNNQYGISGGIPTYHNANVDASTLNGAGGTIALYALGDVLSTRDAALSGSAPNISYIASSGTTANVAPTSNSITITSIFANVDLSEVASVEARNSGAGGGAIAVLAPIQTIASATQGNITSTNINASGTNGGSVSFTSTTLSVAAGTNIISDGTNGNGGTVLASLGVSATLGTSSAPVGTVKNTSNNFISASGTAAGGSIQITAAALAPTITITNYETSLLATGGTGTGGNITLDKASAITLYNADGISGGIPVNYDANFDASSLAGNGGTITLSASAGNITTLMDPGISVAGPLTATFKANSNSANGGVVNINAIAGSIDLSQYHSLNATGGFASATGGTINVTAVLDSRGPIIGAGMNATGANGGAINISGITYNLPSGASMSVSGLAGNGGAIAINAPWGVQLGDMNNQTNNSVSADGSVAGGTITIVGNGNHTFSALETSLTAKGGTGNGGSINISGFWNMYLYNMNGTVGGVPVSYNANIDVSSTSATGGTLSLLSSGAWGIRSYQDPSVTTAAPNQAYISATGGVNGGSITISSYGPVELTTYARVDASSNGTGGNGGSINITTTNDGSILGSTTDFVSGGSGLSGAGGSINLTANTTTGIVSARLISANGAGTGTGGGVTVNQALAGSSSISMGPISASGGSSGSGGIVALSLNSTQVLDIAGAVNADAGSTGNGGSISAVNTGTGGIATSGGSLSAAATNGTGGSLALNSAGAINFTNLTNIVLAPSVSGAGGTAMVQGAGFIMPVASTATIDVSGAGGSDGGSVSLITTSPTPTAPATADIRLGNLAGNFNIVGLNSGTSTNVVATIQSAGNVIVNNGGLIAGGGVVNITANQSISGAGTLTSTGTLNLTATNGSIGTSAANRLNIDGNNVGITANSSAAGNGNAFIQSPGSITLLGTNVSVRNVLDVQSGTVSTAGSGTVSAGSVVFNATSGNIFIQSGAPVSATSGNVTLSSAANITINDSVSSNAASGITTLTAATDVSGTGVLSGSTVSLSSTDGNVGVGTANRINIGGSVTNLVISSAGGSVNAGNAYVQTAGAINLNGANLSIAKTLDVQAGGAIITTGVTTIGAASVSLTTTTGDITIAATAPVSATTGALNINSAGAVNLAGAVASNTVNGTTTISASNNISGSATVAGAIVSLTSTIGNIGIATNARINISPASGTVAVNAPSPTSGNGNVYLQTGTINLDTSNVNKLLDVNANGTIATLGAVNAGTVAMTSSGDITISATGPVSATSGNLNLTAAAAINVLGSVSSNLITGTTSLQAVNDIAGSGTVFGRTVILGSSGGNLGLSPVNRLNIGNGTSSLQLDANAATAGNGNAYLQTDAITVNGANITVRNNFDVVASGTITTAAAAISSGAISLQTTSGDVNIASGAPLLSTVGNTYLISAGNVNLGASVGSNTVTGTTSIQANNNISGAGTISGFTVDLASVNGNVGSGTGARINVSGTTTNLQISATAATAGTGNAYVQSGAISLVGGAVTTQNTLDLQASGQISTVGAGAITVGAATLRTTSGDVSIGAGAPIASSGTMAVTSAGSILLGDNVSGSSTAGITSLSAVNNISGSGIITGFQLTLQSAGGQIGSAGQHLQTGAASSLAANTNGSGSVYLNQTGTANLNASAAGNLAGTVFQYTTDSDLTITSLISAATVVIQALPASNASITINVAPIASQSLTISTGVPSVAGTGDIVTAAGVLLASPSITLTSGAGDIGSAATPIGVSTPVLSAQTGTVGVTTGSVHIASVGALPLLLNNSNAANAFNLSSNTGVTVNAGQSVTASDISLTLPTLVNNGNLTASNQLALQSLTGGLSVTGTGTLAASNSLLTASNGAVALTQDSVIGSLGGSALSSFAATTTSNVQPLNLGSISTTTGAISGTASASNLNVIDGAALNAATNIVLTGATGLSIGTSGGIGVNLSAGRLAPATNATSTVMSDYGTGSFTSSGAISITSTGAITLGDLVAMRSFGGSIGITTTSTVTAGQGDSFFAQGGNIWVYAAGNINLGTNSSFTAVARYIPLAANVNIGTVSVSGYQGGDIAIYAVSSLNPAFGDQYLRTSLELNRVAAGIYPQADPNLTLAGPAPVITNGGTVQITASPGTINGSGSFQSDGGVIAFDPPLGMSIVFNGLQLVAVGPALIAAPPVPTPTPITTTAGPPTAPGNSGTLLSPGIPGILSPTLISPPAVGAVPEEHNPLIPIDTTRMSVTASAAASASTSSSNAYPVQSIVPLGTGTVYYATGCNQYSLPYDKEAMVVADGGTEFSAQGDASDDREVSSTQSQADSSHRLNLLSGKLLLSAERKPIVLRTVHGDAVVASDTSAVVQQNDKGTVRISNLGGTRTTITLGTGANKSVLVAEPGEELVIANASTDDEELIPSDGVDRDHYVSMSVSVSSLKVRKNKFNQQQMFEKLTLLRCQNMQDFKRMVRNNSRTAEMMNKDNRNHVPAASNPLSPVAFSFPSSAAVPSVKSFKLPDGFIKYQSDSHFSTNSENGIVDLASGDIIVSTNKPTVISTGNATLTIKADGVCLVSKRNGIVKVISLAELNQNSVIVSCDSAKPLALSAGQELVVAPDNTSLIKAIDTDGVARRRMSIIKLKEGEAASSEVSLLSLITSHKLLSRLFNSDEATNKNISGKIAKMGVSLSIVTASHGNYATGSHNIQGE